MKPEHKTLKNLLSELDEFENESRAQRTGRKSKWLLPLLVIVIVAGVVAAVALFSQTLPQHTVGAVLTADCTTALVASSPGSGSVLYRCSNAPVDGAFTVANGGTASWSHGGLAGYSQLKIVTSTAGIPTPAITTDCDAPGSVDISTISGSFAFSAGQEWLYCAEYTSPGAFGPITVSWSQ